MQGPSTLYPLAALALASALWLCLHPAAAATPDLVTIKLSVLPGLKFDVPRFAVAPGGRVTIEFRNPDQMIHNFVVTEPGARLEVVMAALAMGADGPAKNFIPESKKVLWSTKALSPGETTTLTFTAPAKEGVYPYVCTFTGHGFVMYGAMYVTTKPLPPLESDPNVPPAAPLINDSADHSHHLLDHPVVSRTFLPDCGPAAIAVGLPGGQSYCFDAGACRLRYAWKGGFVDNNEHWTGKGDAFGKVVGRIYYRASNEQPFRIGDPNKPPTVRWRGYRWINGNPQFHYLVDGVEVSESPQATKEGNGIAFAIEINGAPAKVYYKTHPELGAAFASSAGTWSKGILELTPEQARHFTLNLIERPGVEPIGYWSMNDALFHTKTMPPAGILGGAFIPGGTDPKLHLLDSGINTAELKGGGTLMAWVKLNPPGTNPKSKAKFKRELWGAALQPIFSTYDGKDFLIPAPAERDGRWHHVTVTFGAGQSILYVDGEKSGPAGVALPAKDGNLFIGSAGEKTVLEGLLDEVRIYNRVLSGPEIQKVFSQDKAASQTTP